MHSNDSFYFFRAALTVDRDQQIKHTNVDVWKALSGGMTMVMNCDRPAVAFGVLMYDTLFYMDSS